MGGCGAPSRSQQRRAGSRPAAAPPPRSQDGPTTPHAGHLTKPPARSLRRHLLSICPGPGPFLCPGDKEGDKLPQKSGYGTPAPLSTAVKVCLTLKTARHAGRGARGSGVQDEAPGVPPGSCSRPKPLT